MLTFVIGLALGFVGALACVENGWIKIKTKEKETQPPKSSSS